MISFLSGLKKVVNYMGLAVRKPFFSGLRTTKAQTSLHICADQPAHLRSLISAFVIRLL